MHNQNAGELPKLHSLEVVELCKNHPSNSIGDEDVSTYMYTICIIVCP